MRYLIKGYRVFLTYLPLSHSSDIDISDIFVWVISLCDAKNSTTSRFSFFIGTISNRHQNGVPKFSNNGNKIERKKETTNGMTWEIYQMYNQLKEIIREKEYSFQWDVIIRKCCLSFPLSKKLIDFNILVACCRLILLFFFLSSKFGFYLFSKKYYFFVVQVILSNESILLSWNSMHNNVRLFRRKTEVWRIKYIPEQYNHFIH